MTQREENTPEYRKFKKISNEENILIEYLQKNIPVSESATVLDVGGRQGYISLSIQKNFKNVSVVDLDPTISLLHPEALFINKKAQDLEKESKYDLIICSHVLGDLGKEGVQSEVLDLLVNKLLPRGKIILCFNKNTGFTKKVLDFAKQNLDSTLYDYFDEKLLDKYPKLQKTTYDFSTPLIYESFDELAKCCWVLFGTINQDINKVSDIFIPFLRKELKEPIFVLEQRIVVLNS